MNELFLQILDMSVKASFVILVVLVGRLFLERVPKIFSYVIWTAVLFRLLCPISIESSFSNVPIMPTPSDFAMSEKLSEGISFVDAATAALNVTNVGSEIVPVNYRGIADEEPIVIRVQYAQLWMLFGGYVWSAGVAAMALYSIISLLRLRKRLIGSVKLRDNIFLADSISSPFVLGLISPKIYLPSSLSESAQSYIILHEQTHIKRLDHVVKLVAFLALCLHWFNPLVWIAFFGAMKDMEMSCDESVMNKAETDIKQEYAGLLLSLATGRRIFGGTPLAFGESDTKSRIKNIFINKKFSKPLLALLTAAVLIFVFMNILDNEDKYLDMQGLNVSDLQPQEISEFVAKSSGADDIGKIFVPLENYELMLDSDFNWVNSPAILVQTVRTINNAERYYDCQLRIFTDEERYFVTETQRLAELTSPYRFFYFLSALKALPQEYIESELAGEPARYRIRIVDGGVPEDGSKYAFYNENGITAADSWAIKLEIAPLYTATSGGFYGNGADVMTLFYDHID